VVWATTVVNETRSNSAIKRMNMVFTPGLPGIFKTR